jgi:hypothetical protein
MTEATKKRMLASSSSVSFQVDIQQTRIAKVGPFVIETRVAS